LEGKYEDLVKECEEKSKLMVDQLAEKSNTAETISGQLTTQIDTQQVEIEKQIKIYRE